MNNQSFRQPHLPLASILRCKPNAVANINGSADYPCISGTAKCYQTALGVVVCCEVSGLPDSEPDRIFGCIACGVFKAF
ncbi:MAG: hypothetical protein IJ053_02560 [Lachnospiraceae bacterium]|nr:hypothetical protein [Lachnospiraceae bacterium]